MSNMMLSRKKVLKSLQQAKGKFNRSHELFLARLSFKQLKKLKGILERRKIQLWELRSNEVMSITLDSKNLTIYNDMIQARKLHETLDFSLKLRTA